MNHAELAKRFQEAVPKVEFASLRFSRTVEQYLTVRQDVAEPLRNQLDQGAMVTVVHGGGLGYAASSDLSVAGLREAFQQARKWAEVSARHSLVDFAIVPRQTAKGNFSSPVRVAADDPGQLLDRLYHAQKKLKTRAEIVDWEATVALTDSESFYVTTDGSEIAQQVVSLMPYLRATANRGSDTQSRTLGGIGYTRQGGTEILDSIGFDSEGGRVAEEAYQLLLAETCPSGSMDVVLAPDQMILQIHESIGHPLELDRILGDERNYAGTSFVKPEFFGNYQYGSEYLNVTFDPTVSGERASYGFDDDGTPAAREYLIRRGILERPLGGALSQFRANLPGVANSRACNWNRPPIDRMANLNLEPGDASLEKMIGSIDRGVYMQTNVSWSIDDSRNKFQFGCEWGQVIENGKLTRVVKTPNYRGVSASFWRNLAMVGDAQSFQVLGAPYCGKGEPQQAVHVGHATPAALFRNVEVFGGEAQQ